MLPTQTQTDAAAAATATTATANAPRHTTWSAYPTYPPLPQHQSTSTTATEITSIILIIVTTTILISCLICGLLQAAAIRCDTYFSSQNLDGEEYDAHVYGPGNDGNPFPTHRKHRNHPKKGNMPKKRRASQFGNHVSRRRTHRTPISFVVNSWINEVDDEGPAGGRGGRRRVITTPSNPITPGFTYVKNSNNLEVCFTTTAVDAGGDTLSYQYSPGDASATVYNTPNFCHTYPDYGTYTVVQEVTNADGMTATFSRSITLEFVDNDFHPGFNMQEIDPNQPLRRCFTNEAHESASQWEYDPGDGSGVVYNTPDFCHTYPDYGTYTVEQTVSNDLGASARSLVTITLHGPPSVIPSAVPGAFSYKGNCPENHSNTWTYTGEGITDYTGTKFADLPDGTLEVTVELSVPDNNPVTFTTSNPSDFPWTNEMTGFGTGTLTTTVTDLRQGYPKIPVTNTSTLAVTLPPKPTFAVSNRGWDVVIDYIYKGNDRAEMLASAQLPGNKFAVAWGWEILTTDLATAVTSTTGSNRFTIERVGDATEARVRATVTDNDGTTYNSVPTWVPLTEDPNYPPPKSLNADNIVTVEGTGGEGAAQIVYTVTYEDPDEQQHDITSMVTDISEFAVTKPTFNTAAHTFDINIPPIGSLQDVFPSTVPDTINAPRIFITAESRDTEYLIGAPNTGVCDEHEQTLARGTDYDIPPGGSGGYGVTGEYVVDPATPNLVTFQVADVVPELTYRWYLPDGTTVEGPTAPDYPLPDSYPVTAVVAATDPVTGDVVTDTVTLTEQPTPPTPPPPAPEPTPGLSLPTGSNDFTVDNDKTDIEVVPAHTPTVPAELDGAIGNITLELVDNTTGNPITGFERVIAPGTPEHTDATNVANNGAGGTTTPHTLGRNISTTDTPELIGANLSVRTTWEYTVPTGFQDEGQTKTVQETTAVPDIADNRAFEVRWTDKTGTWDETTDSLLLKYKIFPNPTPETPSPVAITDFLPAWVQTGVQDNPAEHTGFVSFRISNEVNTTSRTAHVRHLFIQNPAAEPYRQNGSRHTYFGFEQPGQLTYGAEHTFAVPRKVFGQPFHHLPTTGFPTADRMGGVTRGPPFPEETLTDVQNTLATHGAFLHFKLGQWYAALPEGPDQTDAWAYDIQAGDTAIELRIAAGTEDGIHWDEDFAIITLPQLTDATPPTAGFTYTNTNGVIDEASNEGSSPIVSYEYQLLRPDGTTYQTFVDVQPDHQITGVPTAATVAGAEPETHGEWTIKLTVTDANGLQDTDTQTAFTTTELVAQGSVAVQAYGCGSNTYALLFDSTGSSGTTKQWKFIQTNGDATSADLTPTLFSDPTVLSGGAAAETVAHTTTGPMVPGDTYPWQLTVTDDNTGETKTTFGTVQVPPENIPNDTTTPYEPALLGAGVEGRPELGRYKIPGSALGLALPAESSIMGLRAMGNALYSTTRPEKDPDGNEGVLVDPHEYFQRAFNRVVDGSSVDTAGNAWTWNDATLSTKNPPENVPQTYLTDLRLEVPFYYDPCMPDPHLVFTLEATFGETAPQTLQGWDTLTKLPGNYDRPACTAGLNFTDGTPLTGPNIKFEVMDNADDDAVPQTLGTAPGATDNTNGNKFITKNLSGKQYLHVDFRGDRDKFVQGWNRCCVAFVDFDTAEAAGTLLVHSVTIPWNTERGFLCGMHPVALSTANLGQVIPHQSGSNYNVQGNANTTEYTAGRTILFRDPNGTGNAIHALAPSKRDTVLYQGRKRGPPMVTSGHGDSHTMWECTLNIPAAIHFSSGFTNDKPFGPELRQLPMSSTGSEGDRTVYDATDNRMLVQSQSGRIGHLGVMYYFCHTDAPTDKTNIFSRYNTLTTGTPIPGTNFTAGGTIDTAQIPPGKDLTYEAGTLQLP